MRNSLALSAILLFACGAQDAASGFASDDAPRANAPNGDATGGAAAPTTPPERELESDYESPVATGNFVWVANPKSGRIAFIDATSLEVRTALAGKTPTYLAKVPGAIDDTTLVLNVGSNDATLLHADKGTITQKTLETPENANTLTFSADGRYAIAWADARKVPNAPRTMGFQDLAVLDLVNGTSVILAVGYRPVAVGFGATGAYAVTQDGIAVIDLAGLVTKNVAISDNPNEDPGSRDVSVTPDGKTALVRRDGSAAVTIVSLDAGTHTDITLPSAVTDLDLSPNGTRAVAVLRDTSQISIIPVAAPATHTEVTITGETVGSVAFANDNRVLLYTNASDVERVTILELDSKAFRTQRLYAPVLALFSSPDASQAVVLHDGTPPAFSLLPIGQQLPAKIVSTNAKPNAVAVTNDRAIVTERDDTTKKYGAFIARLPQLAVDWFPLASPPIAAGVVPSAKRAYVAQEHPEGRLTFFDLDTGVARTLTGFELAARVVDGSKP